MSLTWTSINLESYLTTTRAALDELNSFIDRIIDLKTARIDRLMVDISQSLLFENDKAEYWPLETFIQNVDRYAKAKGKEFSGNSLKIEEALKELTDVVIKRAEATLKECTEMKMSGGRQVVDRWFLLHARRRCGIALFVGCLVGPSNWS